MVDKEEGELSEEGELPEEAQANGERVRASETVPTAPPGGQAAAAQGAAAPAPAASHQQQQQPQQAPPEQPQRATTLSRPRPAEPPPQQRQHQQPPGPGPRDRQPLPPQQHPHHRAGGRPGGGGGGSSYDGGARQGPPSGRPGPPPHGHHGHQHHHGHHHQHHHGPPPQQQQQLGPPLPLHAGARGGGGGGPHSSSRSSGEREKAELAQELERLTADLSFQEIRGNWVQSCQNIKAAIKKLDKLLRRVKKRREDDVELYPPCLVFSGRLVAALKHVLVLTSTGQGKLVDMEVATNTMRAAVNYRHDVFSLAHKRELEQHIRDSREFHHLFTDRDKGKDKDKGGAGGSSKSPGAAAAAAQQQQQPGGEQQQQRVPLARGDRRQQDQQQQEQQQQGGGRAGDKGRQEQQPPPSPPPAPAPPPPSNGAAAASASPASSGGAAEADAAARAQQEQQEQQQQQPVPAAPGFSSWGDGAAGGKPAAAGAAASAAAATAAAAAAAAAGGKGGPQIRIVISSTSVEGGPGPAGAAAAAGGALPAAAAATAAATAAPGKRPLPTIHDLGDGGEGRDGDGAAGAQQHAAKRARRDAQQQQEQEQQREQQQHREQQGDVPPWESEEYQAAAAGVASSPLKEAMARLLRARRLVLVLDLDHTLVNSIKFGEVEPEVDYKLEQLAAEQLGRPREARDLHRLVRLGMWTKLRPGVREFLARAVARFELWIYTAGSRAYAEAMAELLDPSGQYFGPRIIAQGAPSQGAPPPDAADGGPGSPEQGGAVVKRLTQGLEGCEPVVLIVDDSSAVWPHDRRNLFVVERYIYFPAPPSSRRRAAGAAGRSLLEIDRDECPRRGMLMTALAVFEHLHGRLFEELGGAPLSAAPGAAAGWDVRAIMAAEKKRVLSGVHLVFSRVIPLEADARRHPLWQLAQQYGATCSEACGPATTHVVATHAGTEKVMWARQNNKYVVGPAWLECSCILWQRAAEERFPPPM